MTGTAATTRTTCIAKALAALLGEEQPVTIVRDGYEPDAVTVSTHDWEVVIQAGASGDEVRIAAPDHVSEEYIPNRLTAEAEALLIHAVGLGLWDTENDGYDAAGEPPRYRDPAERLLHGTPQSVTD